MLVIAIFNVTEGSQCLLFLSARIRQSLSVPISSVNSDHTDLPSSFDEGSSDRHRVRDTGNRIQDNNRCN